MMSDVNNLEDLDLCTRIRLIEDRQRRQALAMQYLAEAVDRLRQETEEKDKRYDRLLRSGL